jgi:hypothetical protein
VGYTMEVGGVIEAPVVVETKFPGYDEYPEYSGPKTSAFPVKPPYSGPISEEITQSSST